MNKRISTALLFFAVLILTSLGSACDLIPQPGDGGQSVEARKGLETVDEAWKTVFDNYVDTSKLDPAKLSQAAIEGMLEALDDPYTSYLDPELYQSQIEHMKSEYEGIGAHVAPRDGQTIVISTIPDSPAERAGVLPGDIIVEVDGKSTADLSLEATVRLIRGPAGTPVEVTFHRESSAEDLRISLTREAIVLKTVTWSMKDDIVVLRISQFAEPTSQEFAAAAKEIIEEQSTGAAMGAIIDLRSNPGGLLDTVVDVASHFVADGNVLQVVDKDGKRAPIAAEPGKDQIDLPLIVLVDEFSASGSEVLSGTLRDRLGATIAGSRTFGKGSVNRFFGLPNGGAIYVTISRWETPNGDLIEGKGIEPDIPLDLVGDDLIDWAVDYLHQQNVPNTSVRMEPAGVA